MNSLLLLWCWIFLPYCPGLCWPVRAGRNPGRRGYENNIYKEVNWSGIAALGTKVYAAHLAQPGVSYLNIDITAVPPRASAVIEE